MRREEKVEAIKAKIRSEISDIKQLESVKINLCNFDRSTILSLVFILALEDYCDSDIAFNDWYSASADGQCNYIVSEETLDMMLEDDCKIVRHFLVSAREKSDDSLFYSKDILTDKWIQFELFTTLEKCMFENERKGKKK